MADLLLELFSEEIPARMQKRASEDLRKLVTNGLVEAGLDFESAAAFVTPRRLCLTVTGLAGASPDVSEQRKGPRLDAPEKALEGFLRATGLRKEQLEIRDDKKGQVFFARIDRPGRPASDILAGVIPEVIQNFPWPKSMRWGTGSLRWVRPLHSILCILHDQDGANVVPFTLAGLQSGNQTRGHRFMAPDSFAVTSFEDYQARLATAKVMLDSEERADSIWQEATNLAFAQGMDVVRDAGLLAEVAGLVEYPKVLIGDIAADFLDLPPEVLQTSMKEHQKFFSVKNPKTGRIEKFITVANRETADHGASILAGNQKVLFARLSDAKFFWENDLRTVRAIGLEGMGKPLEHVTFHNKLGSQADRVTRISSLAREIASFVGAAPDLAAEAARVAKADLASEMVYEFPELQGLMGRYYATQAGLPQAVSEACQDHYSPLGPGDEVPHEPVSVAVALADKIDTLTGFWAIDERPTGSKDPFALRRAALGVIRLILENSARLRLLEFFCISNSCLLKLLSDDTEMSQKKFELLNFFHDRLKVFLRDEGISHDVIDACLAMTGSDDFVLLVNRARALQAFLKTDDGENLLQGFKRANNILRAEEKKDGVSYELDPELKLAEGAPEKDLFAALDRAGGAISPAIEAEDFAAAMAAMADLRAPIDSFFEAVQVNAENQVLRRNRLCLLNRIRLVMGQAADFTKIEG